MRIRHALLSCAVSLTLSIGLAPPAVAQSFFQKLLGFGSSAPAPAVVQPPPRSIPAYRFQPRYERRLQSRPEVAAEDDEFGPPDSGGPYRTMCVRACDGFYFPLRHNAWRRNFQSDAKSCRSACGEEAKLFYYSLRGGSVETMTDLAGRAYKDLPHAFGYRKALVSGCTCKPVPWSYEEAARHQTYAAAEAQTMRATAQRIAATGRQFAAFGSVRGVAAAGSGVPADGEIVAEAPAAAIEAAAANGEDGTAVQALGSDDGAAKPASIRRGTDRMRRYVTSSTGEAERPLRRRGTTRVQRVRYAPTVEKPSSGFSLFGGGGSSKYTWPGD